MYYKIGCEIALRSLMNQVSISVLRSDQCVLCPNGTFANIFVLPFMEKHDLSDARKLVQSCT